MKQYNRLSSGGEITVSGAAAGNKLAGGRCGMRRSSGQLRHLFLAAGLASVVVVTPAWAEQDELLLAPITVAGSQPLDVAPTEETGGYAAITTQVGTKLPATLREMPRSVSVVTRDVIEDRNYTTLDELAYGTPGLRVLDSGRGRSSIYARGFEYSEYNIDGLPAPMASILGTVPNLVAFDRVEILRGPSGLFNSTSEMGGIINLVLKQPTATFQGHAEARYGTHGQHYETLDLSGPIAGEGRVRGRLVVADSGADGFPEGTENGSRTFFGTLDIDMTNDTLLSLSLLRQSRDMVVDNGLPTDAQGNLIDFGDDVFAGAPWNNFDMESYDAIAEVTHEFEDGAKGHAGVRYSNRNADFNYIFGGSALQANGMINVRGLGGVLEQNTWSADANYSRPFDLWGQTSEFVVGADYRRYKTDQLMARARLGSIDFDDFGTYPFVDIAATNAGKHTLELLEAYGLYSKLTLRPTAALSLIGGLRVSAYDVKYGNKGTGVTHERSDSSRLTPYAGVVYDVGEHHTLYASYSSVFKPQTGHGSNGKLLKPREGRQYEVGVKGSYFGGEVNTRLTAFYLKDKNAGMPVPGQSYQEPLGKRRVQGVEVEVAGALTPNLDLIFGYTYLDTKVDAGGRKAQSVFMLMPEHRANLWALYHFNDGPMAGLSLGAGITAVSSFSSIQGVEAPSYTVVNAMVGYQFSEQLSAQLNVNNIFDKAYYRRVGSMGTFNMRGEPINAVASLRYAF